jgi:hypothetical protein
MQDEFDVFLSHNSRDKPEVEKIGARLRTEELRVWLDKWELRPGFPWQEGLEQGVRTSRAVAVFVGAEGLGAWEQPEVQAFIARSKREQVPVIPVLLPGCPDSPPLTVFLEAFTWVDLRGGVTDDGFAQLLWGITGTKPAATGAENSTTIGKGGRPVVEARGPRTARAGTAGPPDRAKARWTRWRWGVGLSVLGVVVLTLGAWLWLRFPGPPPLPPKPGVYAIRVQVLDPDGRPVEGSTVRTSAGNEPQRTPDEWWEIEVPAAKVPADGLVTLWATHKEWDGNQTDLRLGEDPNPSVKIRLKEPESWIRGRVVDGHDRGLAGARISRQDGAPGEATTEAGGRFELKLSVPRETRVRLRADLAGFAQGDEFCYAGAEDCSFALRKK